MGQRTPLYQQHVDAGARIVDFGGWDMPLHYGSQLDEHHDVRSNAGVFDVSHMTVVDLEGKDARVFLQYLLANDVARLQERGKALYSCMLNHQGGVVDDLIVYFLDDDRYRLIVNAGTREKDLAWIAEQAATYELGVTERAGLAMIAVQGPNARSLAAAMIPDEIHDTALALKPFFGLESGDWFVARTGYTGEDGWEIVVPSGAEITSGGFSPTMQRSIAMARMPAGDYSRAQVDVRGRLLDVSVVKIPFVRNGQVLTKL